MFKVALIGGLIAAFSLSPFTLGDLLYGLIGLGVTLFMLAIVTDIVAGIYERIGRRRDGMHYGHSVRMQRTRSAP